MLAHEEVPLISLSPRLLEVLLSGGQLALRGGEDGRRLREQTARLL